MKLHRVFRWMIDVASDPLAHVLVFVVTIGMFVIASNLE